MSQQPNRPSAEQMAKFKKNANDSSLSAEVRAKFKAIVDKFENVTEEVGEDVVKEVEPAKKRGRKPRAKSTTTKTTKTTKTKQSPSDVEKAKAEIKAKTGKTEEECEAIIEQYRALRTKAQQGKRKAEQASADNKKRVDKLENKGDLIEGTNVKTADAVIESTAKDVAEKIEQQIEAVEEKAEKEAKAEVAKDNKIKTPKDKKEAVKEKVEEKVKKETKVVVERVVIDTSALLTSIATSLGKFDKDSQKEFLIKLRSDIDKLLAKYAFGGMTDGAVQMMNIQQSNLSASSVNPTMFAKGGGVNGNVSDLDYSDILEDLEVLLTDSVDELSNEFENKFNADGEEVEHQSRDGFIAFTDGGYEVRWFESLRQYFTSGYSLPTKALEKEKDRQIDLSLEDAKDYFKNEYPEIVEKLGEENIDYNSLYEAGYESEAEDLDEVEMDMMDGTIMCEIGAYYYKPNNDRGIDGKHTLRLFGLVNLESPYHRSGNLEDRYDIDITFDSIDELNEKVSEGLKDIIDWFNGSHYFKSTEELRIRRMAKGGLTEHGLRLGDKIVSKGIWTIKVEDSKNKKHIVNLNTGTREDSFKKGGNISSMLRNRRGM